MIEFVNAKINIGLQIVRKRKDGYHDLQTVFYPVGLYAGSAENPESFCDLLEIVKADSGSISGGMPEFIYLGRKLECDEKKNLIYKAARVYKERTGIDISGIKVLLEKHLPDGAGLGGGSADAAFMLKMLAAETGDNEIDLYALARSLGADCPFFLLNRPCFATGIGDCMEPINLQLSGKWLVVVKPDIYISTAEAFSGVDPRPGNFDLRLLPDLPIEMWRERVFNDFETSLFPKYRELGEIKESLYDSGALYSSMTGSGSAIYGIFENKEKAETGLKAFNIPTIEGCYLLKM